MSADRDVPLVQGLELFEIYEASGALLFVTSALDHGDLSPGDIVVRRAWATAAPIVARRTVPARQ